MNIAFSSTRAPGPASAKQRRIVQLPVAAGLITAGVVMVLLSVVAGFPLTFGGECLTAAGLTGLLIVMTERIRSRPGTLAAPRAWSITDDGLLAGTNATSVRWAWDAVRRVEERRDAYLLFQDDEVFPFDVPRDGLSAEQDQEFRTHLTARGLLS
jgi:hypothetical protein